MKQRSKQAHRVIAREAKQSARPLGVSLIITVLFTSFFLLIIIGLAQTTLFALRDTRDFTRLDQSFHVAHGVTDLLHYTAQQEDIVGREIQGQVADTGNPSPAVGPNMAEINSTRNGNGGASVITALSSDAFSRKLSPSINYRIFARSPATLNDNLGTSWHVVPAPSVDSSGTVIGGTGNAASKCQNASDLDDPCHWNRLPVGESVQIPLFYVDDDDDEQRPSKFQLRIRTPCENGEINCVTSGRINLFTGTTSHHVRQDPTLVAWEITDASSRLSLTPSTDLDPNTPNTRDNLNNSELYASVINSARSNNYNYMALDGANPDDSGIRTSDTSFKQRINYFLDSLSTNSKPYFHLQLSIPPKKQGWDSTADTTVGATSSCERAATALSNRKNDCLELLIHYLEYQILVDQPIADEKRIARATVEIGDFAQTFESDSAVSGVPSPFVLETED